VQLPSRPTPIEDDISRPFWDACRQHELRVQRCEVCHNFQYFPGPICRACASTDLTWSAVSGLGTVYSFVVVHNVVTPGFPPDQPYVVAWIELPEQRGLRLLSNVVDCPLNDVRIDLRVEVAFLDSDDFSVPVFHPAT